MKPFIRILCVLALSSNAFTQVYLSYESSDLLIVNATARWDDAYGRIRNEAVSTENYGLQGDIIFGQHIFGNGIGLATAGFILKLGTSPFALESQISVTSSYPSGAPYSAYYLGSWKQWPFSPDIQSSWISLSRPGFQETKITGTSSVGQVGYSIDDQGMISSFILSEGNYSELTVGGLPTKITGAYGDKIVGNITEPNATFGTLTKTFISTVPEPSSLSLLLAGGVVALARRRKSS